MAPYSATLLYSLGNLPPRWRQASSEAELPTSCTTSTPRQVHRERVVVYIHNPP